MSQLHEIVQNEREKAQLTQFKMAERLNMSRRTYQRREKGQLTLIDFEKICKELGLVVLVLPADNVVMRQ